jgi:hypothetical protein
MGNKPSGIQVLRQPTTQLEHYDYTFDLSGIHANQINTYFLKPLRAHKQVFRHDTSAQKLYVESMIPPVFETLFRHMKPIMSVERARSSSREIIPKISRDDNS